MHLVSERIRNGMMPGGDLSWLLKVWNKSFCWLLSNCSKAIKCCFEIGFVLSDWITSLWLVYFIMGIILYRLCAFRLASWFIMRWDVIVASTREYYYGEEDEGAGCWCIIIKHAWYIAFHSESRQAQQYKCGANMFLFFDIFIEIMQSRDNKQGRQCILFLPWLRHMKMRVS